MELRITSKNKKTWIGMIYSYYPVTGKIESDILMYKIEWQCSYDKFSTLNNKLVTPSNLLVGTTNIYLFHLFYLYYLFNLLHFI